MEDILNPEGLDILFNEARTHHGWLDKSIPDDLLRKVYDLAKWGPTSANCCPMRLVFVKSSEAKEKLKSTLSSGNVNQTMTAPVTAIIAYDMEFYEHMSFLYPIVSNVKSWFTGSEETIFINAFRNGTLQGAYFIMAARACGLDCGPMSGFDNALVDKLFFEGTTFKSNFLCNLGYGDANKLYPRGPRFDFEDVCQVL